MAVQAIQSNMNAKAQNNGSSYLRAGAIGALGGLAAKLLIPVSKPELDTFVSSNNLKNARKLSAGELSFLAKKSRSNFDFAVITAATLMAATFFKNMYTKLADKS